jgi:hypothetical protein
MATKKFDPKIILEHPDFNELVAKMAIGISCADISEWLSCKYESVGERKFCLSENTLKVFYDQYYDFYTIIRADSQKVLNSTPTDQIETALANNPTYQTALNKYVDSEVDIRLTAKKVVAIVETRAAQVFDMIQEDPRNTKMDKGLIEWMNLLFNACERFESIQNGTSGSQVNIQNNINIQVVDKHISVVCNLITEILAKIDLDASLLFMDRFNEEMAKLSVNQETPLPIDVRLNEAKAIEATMVEKSDR